MQWITRITLTLIFVGIGAGFTSPGDTNRVSCGRAVTEFIEGPYMDVSRRTSSPNPCYDPAVDRLQIGAAFVGAGLALYVGGQVVSRRPIPRTWWRSDPDHDATYEYLSDISE